MYTNQQCVMSVTNILRRPHYYEPVVGQVRVALSIYSQWSRLRRRSDAQRVLCHARRGPPTNHRLHLRVDEHDDEQNQIHTLIIITAHVVKHCEKHNTILIIPYQLPVNFSTTTTTSSRTSIYSHNDDGKAVRASGLLRCILLRCPSAGTLTLAIAITIN